MGGMMGGGRVPDLKTLKPNMQVKAITYCHDTYRVTTADGKKRAFWERNLRLKTDSSKEGPQNGAPALVPAGMMGDRADVIFAAPRRDQQDDRSAMLTVRGKESPVGHNPRLWLLK
jgi:cytochrome c